MSNTPDFEPAMVAVFDELDYQEEVWGARVPEAVSGGPAFDRSLDEYTLYINRYADKMAAGNCVTPEDFNQKVHTVRKIAALAVACLATHGPLTREEENAS